MGGAVSSGQDNDELVDNLMESGYIRTKKVEQVFRAIDRADYVLSSHREGAYKDLAWKHGNIHLSAPCVYSEVMEGLSLEPGLSFLNLGSGTGYLSTMAGLLLQQHGTNHGIELHEDCLKYAYDRLDEFKQRSLALNEFDFCEPLFIQGNCLSVVPGRQYDRVYCGAACPESHEAFIKQFVRIGGILVMPYKEHLLRVERVTEDTWMEYTMLPVSFATLVIPSESEHNLFHLPECDPLSLQELCRGKIRHRLRQNIWHEHADLETEKSILPGQRRSSPQRTLRSFVIPIFEESDELLTDEEQDYPSAPESGARFLLNVDSQPSEAITTTLQLVRAVIQPNQNDSQQNRREGTRTVNENSTSVRECERREKSAEKNTASSTSEDDTGHSSTMVMDTTTDNNNKSRSERNAEKSLTISTPVYCNMSESESDAEQESIFARRKKIAKREKTDSGIGGMEDVNLRYDESSSSSNTNHSDSEITDTTDGAIDAMDIDLPPISKFERQCVHPPPSISKDSTSCSRESEIVAHYIDSNAFAVHMREKIQQLPLPFSVKLYINYNRKF